MDNRSDSTAFACFVMALLLLLGSGYIMLTGGQLPQIDGLMGTSWWQNICQYGLRLFHS